MDVIRHENETVDPAWIFFFGQRQGLEKKVAVIITEENRLMIIASIYNVIWHIGYFCLAYRPMLGLYQT